MGASKMDATIRSPLERSAGTVPDVQGLRRVLDALTGSSATPNRWFRAASSVEDPDGWFRAVPAEVRSGYVWTHGYGAARAIPTLTRRRGPGVPRPPVVGEAALYVPSPPSGLFERLPTSNGGCIHHYRSGSEDFAVSVGPQRPWQRLGAGGLSVSFRHDEVADPARVLNGAIAVAGAAGALRASVRDGAVRLDPLTDAARPWPNLDTEPAERAAPAADGDAVWYTVSGAERQDRVPLSFALGLPTPPRRLRPALSRLIDVLPDIELHLSSVPLTPDLFSDAFDALRETGAESEWELEVLNPIDPDAVEGVAAHALAFELPVLRLRSGDVWGALRVDYGLQNEDQPDAGAPAAEWAHDGRYRLTVHATGGTSADRERVWDHVRRVVTERG